MQHGCVYIAHFSKNVTLLKQETLAGQAQLNPNEGDVGLLFDYHSPVEGRKKHL